MDNFLPPDYKAPDDSNYMKFKEGANTFRVLSSAIVGWSYWTNENKPVRSATRFEGIPADIRVEKDGKIEKIKHFWAFIVWNYESERVQILEIDKKTIQEPILAYVKNPRWGDPKMYDITVNKSGSGWDTEYLVQANPPIALPVTEILQALKRTPINLNAIYTGEDPFAIQVAPGQSPATPQPTAPAKVYPRPVAKSAAPAPAPATPAAPVGTISGPNINQDAIKQPNPLYTPEEQAAEDAGQDISAHTSITDEDQKKLAEELGF